MSFHTRHLGLPLGFPAGQGFDTSLFPVGGGSFRLPDVVSGFTAEASAALLSSLTGPQLRDVAQFADDPNLRSLADSILEAVLKGGAQFGAGLAQSLVERITGQRTAGQECDFPAIQLPDGSCLDVTKVLPGGDPVRFGQAQLGIFGAPALVPNSRSVRTLECPRGLILGKDDLCYAKNSIPNKLRKWPKGPRPAVSAHDRKMMRKFGPGGSKQAAVKRLAMDAGFSCKKR